MNEQLQNMLARIPLVPVLVVYACFMGWSYYSFATDPASALQQKAQSLQQIQQQVATEQEKVKKAREFYQTLQQRRTELRALALQLEQAKATLSEEVDVSSFIRMVVGEANKVGMTVMGIKPTESSEHEYYVQQPFELKVRGAFVQLRVFLHRLSELERIVRVGKLSLKPIDSADSQYVLLDGSMELETYRYRGSHADELGKADSGASAAGGAK